MAQLHPFTAKRSLCTIGPADAFSGLCKLLDKGVYLGPLTNVVPTFIKTRRVFSSDAFSTPIKIMEVQGFQQFCVYLDRQASLANGN